MAQNGSESAHGPIPKRWRAHAHSHHATPQDQQHRNDISTKTDIGDTLTQDTPKPKNTKKAAKRRKHTFGPRQPGMRQPNPIGLIYRKGTDATIADKDTEARLSTTGPSTSVRYGGMQFIW